MRIACNVCNAQYDIDEDRIPADGLSVKCPQCLSVFDVHLAAEPDLPAPAGVGGQEPHGSDLPAPVRDDLPAPAGGRDLPAVRGNRSDATPARQSPGASLSAERPELPEPPPWTQGGSASARGEGDSFLDEPGLPAPWQAPPTTPPTTPDAPSPWETPGQSMWENAGPAPLGQPIDPAANVGPAADDYLPVPASGPGSAPAAGKNTASWPQSPGGSPWEAGEAPQPTPWEAQTPQQPPPAPAQPWQAPPAADQGGLEYGDLFTNVGDDPQARRVESTSYTVRRGAEVFGPYDQVSVRSHLETGRLVGDEEASTDGGVSWRLLSELPEFSDLVDATASELAKVEAEVARQQREVVGQGGRERGLSSAPGSTLATPDFTGIAGAGPSGLEANKPHDLGWGSVGAQSPATFGQYSDSAPVLPPTSEPPEQPAEAPPPKSSIPRPAEKPAWMAPVVTDEGGRAYADARKSVKRRRIALIVALGLCFCGAAAFFLLWDPGFEGEEALRKRIALDDAQLKRYRAQGRTLIQTGTYRGYATARTRLASVVRSDPTDRMAKSLYLQALTYLMRDYGQTRIIGEAAKVRKELARAQERGLEFQKAKVGYALYERDRAAAIRILERVLAAQPKDREALYLRGRALSTAKEAPKAVKVFDRLIKLDPKSAKYLRGKAEAQLHFDRPASITTFRDIVAKHPRNAGAAVRLAQLYAQDGRREDARRLFAWVIDPRGRVRREAAPDESARAHTYLGRIALADGDRKTARKYLEAALRFASSDLERVQALLTLGDLLMAERKFGEAVKRLEEAKRRQPGSPDVLWRLAVAYVQGGKSVKARRAIVDGMKVLRSRRIAQLSPVDSRRHFLEAARLQLASARVNQGDEIPRLAEATDDYEKAVESAKKAGGPDAKVLSLSAHVGHASLLRRQKNLGGAQKQLELARAIDSESAVVHNAFGELYADQGKPKEAETAYRAALAKEGRFLAARFNLSSLLADQGRLAAALKQLKAIQKADPGYPGVNLAMAISFQKQKRYTDAIEAFERAVKANPNDPRVFLRIGIAYFELSGQENLNKSRTYLDKSIEKNRQLNEAYYWRGRVLLQLKKPEVARDDFKTAADREPDNGVYRIYWGWAYEKTGSMRDAMFQYNRAISLLQQQKNEVDIALAFYRRGRLRLERDEVKAALKDLDMALKYDSANTEVLVLLGDSLAKARRHKEAVARYRTALSRGKRIKGLWFKLGRSLLEIHQRAEAQMAMRRAVAESPQDCYPHYYLGYLFKDGKDEVRAVASLRRFLRLCPKAPERKDANRDIFDMERRMGRVKGP